jgi:hypothetical protein
LPLWFFHISRCSPLPAFFLSSHFRHGQETQARADSSVWGLRWLGILRGGVLLWVRGVSGSHPSAWVVWWFRRLPGARGGGLDLHPGRRALRVAGSDESEYSSDEEDSPEEDGGGGEGDDDDDDDDDGGDDGGGRGGNGSSRGGNRGGSGGGRGGNKASG